MTEFNLCNKQAQLNFLIFLTVDTGVCYPDGVFAPAPALPGPWVTHAADENSLAPASENVTGNKKQALKTQRNVKLRSTDGQEGQSLVGQVQL